MSAVHCFDKLLIVAIGAFVELCGLLGIELHPLDERAEEQLGLKSS